MACNQNGKTYYNSLTPYSGGTDASTTYLLDCTHYTCNNRQMCITADGFPMVNNFSIQVLGVPRAVGSEYCCDIRCICDLTYEQVCRCGNTCTQTEKVIVTKCIPCPSADVPTVTAVGVTASPVGTSCRSQTTNVVDVEFALTVATGA